MVILVDEELAISHTGEPPPLLLQPFASLSSENIITFIRRVERCESGLRCGASAMSYARFPDAISSWLSSVFCVLVLVVVPAEVWTDGEWPNRLGPADLD